MKNFKYILASILLAFVLFFPTVLVGCAKKHYTVSIKVAEGEGAVYKIKSINGENRNENIVKDNDVEEGSVFEYVVTASEHYKIAKIVEDGVEKEFNLDESATETSGCEIARLTLTKNVQANHSIDVYFALKTYSFSFYYLDDKGTVESTDDEYSQLKVNDQIYLLSGEYNTNFELNDTPELIFKHYVKRNGIDELENYEIEDNKLMFINNKTLYTDSSRADLITKLKIEE